MPRRAAKANPGPNAGMAAPAAMRSSRRSSSTFSRRSAKCWQRPGWRTATRAE